MGSTIEDSDNLTEFENQQPEEASSVDESTSGNQTAPSLRFPGRSQKLSNLLNSGGPTNPLRSAGKNLGKNLTKNALKNFTRNAAKQAVIRGAQAAATWIAGIGWPVFLFILLLLIVFIIILNKNEDETQNLLQLTKEGPKEAKSGETVSYTINVGYPGTAQDIIITDQLPDGTEYLDSDPEGKRQGNTITWDLADIIGSASGTISNVNTTITVRLKATKDNDYIINIAKGSVIGASNTNMAANTNNYCNGAYTDILKTPPDNLNYGDPQCDLSSGFSQYQSNKDPKSLDQLNQLIQQLDPSNAQRWFNTIIPCMSSYNPNYTDTNKNAYGLFGMNPELGKVDWRTQAKNAVNYNNSLSEKWSYWTNCK